jgi:hypothetical protein
VLAYLEKHGEATIEHLGWELYTGVAAAEAQARLRPVADRLRTAERIYSTHPGTWRRTIDRRYEELSPSERMAADNGARFPGVRIVRGSRQ